MEQMINFGNGFQVIIWKVGNEAFIGIVNANGYVITDRKLTTEEADKIHGLTHCP